MSSFMPARKPCASASRTARLSSATSCPPWPSWRYSRVQDQLLAISNGWQKKPLGNLTEHDIMTWQFPMGNFLITASGSVTVLVSTELHCASQNPRPRMVRSMLLKCQILRGARRLGVFGCWAIGKTIGWLVDTGTYTTDLLGITKLTKLGKPINQPYYQIDWGFVGNSSRESYQAYYLRWGRAIFNGWKMSQKEPLNV